MSNQMHVLWYLKYYFICKYSLHIILVYFFVHYFGSIINISFCSYHNYNFNLLFIQRSFFCQSFSWLTLYLFISPFSFLISPSTGLEVIYMISIFLVFTLEIFTCMYNLTEYFYCLCHSIRQSKFTINSGYRLGLTCYCCLVVLAPSPFLLTPQIRHFIVLGS